MHDIDSQIGTPSPQLIESLASFEGDILVLGAAGKMGLHLSMQLERALRQNGRPGHVRAVSRFQSLRGRDDFEAVGMETIPCDLSDASAVAQLPEATAIFYLAGVKFGTASSPELLHKMNIHMPSLVASRYKSARVVALSTGCVYPFVTPSSGGAKEDDPVDPVGEYARSCLGREEAFTQASQMHGTRCVLIRLNYSCEYRYGVLVDVATRVYNKLPIDVSTGYLNAIWQSDAIDMIARSLSLATSPPVILNVTGPDIISLRDLAGEFGKRFDREVTFEGNEADTAWLSDASKAHRLFGFPAVDYGEMIDRTAQWTASGGRLWGKPTNFESRDGNF